MIDTILFDLDGTLVQFSQEAFIASYFGLLKKVFAKIGLDPEIAANAVWEGTKAMISNDGSILNKNRFWAKFSELLNLKGEKLQTVEVECDRFYSNEFDTVKSVVVQNDVSERLVRSLSSRGYEVVLATNPLFPECAIDTRLSWIGLCQQDFRLITHYANSTFCKPNPEYFNEVFKKIGKSPKQCFMVGNNPIEDMCVNVLGTESFLVTDFIENPTGVDISEFRKGTLSELDAYLGTFPNFRNSH